LVLMRVFNHFVAMSNKIDLYKMLVAIGTNQCITMTEHGFPYNSGSQHRFEVNYVFSSFQFHHRKNTREVFSPKLVLRGVSPPVLDLPSAC
jgi:hypothetical protein